MSGSTYEGWVVVFVSGTDYEADLVRNRLDDADIPAIVLTQRDHAINLTIGDLAQVRVLVQPEHVEEAARLLSSTPPSDEELERAALAAAPSPDAHHPKTQALLDAGIEKIRRPAPREDDEQKGA